MKPGSHLGAIHPESIRIQSIAPVHSLCGGSHLWVILALWGPWQGLETFLVLTTEGRFWLLVGRGHRIPLWEHRTVNTIPPNTERHLSQSARGARTRKPCSALALKGDPEAAATAPLGDWRETETLLPYPEPSELEILEAEAYSSLLSQPVCQFWRGGFWELLLHPSIILQSLSVGSACSLTSAFTLAEGELTGSFSFLRELAGMEEEEFFPSPPSLILIHCWIVWPWPRSVNPGL